MFRLLPLVTPRGFVVGGVFRMRARTHRTTRNEPGDGLRIVEMTQYQTRIARTFDRGVRRVGDTVEIFGMFITWQTGARKIRRLRID